MGYLLQGNRGHGAPRRLFTVLLALGALSLAACSTSSRPQNFTALAPMPPQKSERSEISTVQLSHNIEPSYTARWDYARKAFVPEEQYAHVNVQDLQNIEPAAGFQAAEIPSGLEEETVRQALSEQSVPGHCKLHHRFDRKALIAYEWGDSRLGLDVDGVNMRNAKPEGLMVKYRMRFSPDPKTPYKKKREKCRYESGWQGMIGSGYNEFFNRESDTVWQGVQKIRGKVDDMF